MRRVLLMLAAGIGVFVVVFSVYLPARWALRLLPAQLTCTEAAGSLWSGSCAQLLIRNQLVGQVDWKIQPVRLLRARLAAQVTVHRSDGDAQAGVELGLGRFLLLQDVIADLPLDPVLVPGLPANWRGRMQLRLEELQATGPRIERLRGTLQARDIIATGTRPAAFGSYELLFAAAPDANASLHGQLRDLGGPVALQGTAVIARDGSWQIDGLVSARADADPTLMRQLEYLGSPDTDGRRPFSVAGSF